jgi:hypothetical protein
MIGSEMATTLFQSPVCRFIRWVEAPTTKGRQGIETVDRTIEEGVGTANLPTEAHRVATVAAVDSADQDQARTAEDRFEWSPSSFAKQPSVTLRGVLEKVLQDPSHKKSLTDALFPLLFEGAPVRRRLVYSALMAFANSPDILRNAWRTYLRVGDVEHLTTAAALLEDLGAASWETLRAFARTGFPEASYFVPAIARLTGIDRTERLDVLIELARSADPEMRWRIYEASDSLPEADMVSLLRILADSEACDDSAKDSAKERLRSSDD